MRNGNSKTRATVTLTDEGLTRVQSAAKALGLQTSDYIRRALALAAEVDKYRDADGVITILADTNNDGHQEQIRVVSAAS